MDSDNLTSPPTEESDEANTLTLGILYIIAGLLVMVSNGLVLFVIVRTKALRQPTLWVISHMAFWDFVNGVTIFVILLPSALLNRFAYPDRYLGLVSCLLTYLFSLLFFNVATIVLDRWVCLRFPLAYVKMSRSKYAYAAIVVNILAVSRMLLVAFPDMDFYYSKVVAMPLSVLSNIQESFASLGFLGAAFIIIIVCSALIVHTVKQRRRRIGQAGAHVVSRNNIKLSIMSVLSAAVFCISFVPLIIVQLISLAGHGDNMPEWVGHIVIMCILSNSVWNVLIYSATYQPFRESLIYIFCRSYFRKMLRKRHGIRTHVKRADIESTVVSRPSQMEPLSAEALFKNPIRFGHPEVLHLASIENP